MEGGLIVLQGVFPGCEAFWEACLRSAWCFSSELQSIMALVTHVVQHSSAAQTLQQPRPSLFMAKSCCEHVHAPAVTRGIHQAESALLNE